MTRLVHRLAKKNAIFFSAWRVCFKRNVSTLSPLATAFNTRPGQRLNLSFEGKTGLFGLEELRTYDGFYLLKENVILDTEKLVEEACNPKRDRRIVDIFDELSDSLCKVADLAEFVRLAHPKNSFSHAAEEACIAVSGLVEKLNTNRELYNVLNKVVQEGDQFPTSTVERHVANLFLFDFEQCGIHLEEEQRKVVVGLNDTILQLGQKFMAGSLVPRMVPKKVIPYTVRHLFNSDGENVLISGLCSDNNLELAREVAYKIYLLPEPSQMDYLKRLLKARQNLANICGFPTYAHRALNLSLAETPDNVMNFLDELNNQLSPLADEDFNQMFEMKKKESVNTPKPLAPWDVSHFTNKAKTQWLQVPEFSTYFSLGSCMHGLDNLTKTLFGISLVYTPVQPGEAWTPDIYKLEVVHELEGPLGVIYCDFYERTNKPNQDCHFTIRGGKRLPNGHYQNPVVVLMLNLPSPKWSHPSLLSPNMVDNLFHEFGHALHSMLARTEHQHVTGTRCSTDFAEVPSVLMEYFAADPRVLKTFARHYITGAQMPDDMVEKLCASKKVFAAAEMQAQVFYSVLDHKYHTQDMTGHSTTDVLASVQDKYYKLPYVENTAWELRFSHLVGYGAKYYSYLMSKAVASWVWAEHFRHDPLSRVAGERYRRECLAFGGAKPAKQLVADFLGKQVHPSSLAEALIKDIEQPEK